MNPVAGTTSAPLLPVWAAAKWSDDLDFPLILIAIMIGLTAATVALVELVRRTLAPRKPLVAKPPRHNPALGVVTLPIGLREPNAFDPSFARFPGPFGEEHRAPQKPSMPWRQVACPPLRGRVVLVSLFVGADGTRWTGREIARHLASLKTAARWMEEQAGRYGVEAGVGLSDVYFETLGETSEEIDLLLAQSGGEVGLHESKAPQRAITMMSRAAASLGFRDAVDFVQEVAARLPETTVAWLLHLRMAGRSFAVPLDRTELDGVSLAFCHARQANFTEPIIRPPVPRAAILAHEVLHLFGAKDNYGWPISHFPPGTVTAADVMRLESERLSDLRVDPKSAQELGWLD